MWGQSPKLAPECECSQGSAMVKIVDVARHAKVSTATVSRVINKNAKVADDLRERVERSIAELGYNLNVAARSLRTRRSSKLLLIVPDISNPFFADIIRGAEEAARESNFSVMVGDTGGDPELEERYAALLDRREVDGLVVLGHRIPAQVKALLKRQGAAAAPVVHGCEYSPNLGVPSVHIDNVMAGQDAILHLLQLGHRRIGIVTGPLDSPLSQDRLEGAQAATCKISDADLILRNGDFSLDSGYKAAQELVGEGVTAIFCFSDEMALGALRALADAGVRCPADISVMGFDDISFAAFSFPRLTTIAQPRHMIGRTTVNLLLGKLRGQEAQAESVVLGHDLIIRASTAPMTAK